MRFIIDLVAHTQATAERHSIFMNQLISEKCAE